MAKKRKPKLSPEEIMERIIDKEQLKERKESVKQVVKEEEPEKIDSELLNYINSSIEKRKQAKIDKNYDLADSIRKELLEKGIVLKDTREGTIFEVIK